MALAWVFGGILWFELELELELELEIGFGLGTNLGKCSVVTGLRGWL
jgi:hypothetical protein